MTGIGTLDVIIALAFIFLIYSLMSSIVAEIIADLLRLRARNLEMYLRFMLSDDNKMRWKDIFGQRSKYAEDLFHSFLNLPSIKNLSRKRLFQKSGPSYMKAETFVDGLVDTLLYKTEGETELERIKKGIENFEKGDSDTAKHLKRLLEKSQNDLVKFKSEVEKWFDNSMERCASSYKQLVQWKLLIIGFVVAFYVNLDIITITKKLADNEKLAKQMVIYANEIANPNGNANIKDININDYDKNIEESLGIGEKLEEVSLHNIIGYIIAALGISLGAPFWFDLLGKLVKLRTAIQPINAEKKEGNAEKKKIERVG